MFHNGSLSLNGAILYIVFIVYWSSEGLSLVRANVQSASAFTIQSQSRVIDVVLFCEIVF